MRTQTEVHFKGVDKSEAIEARILEKMEKLESHFDRLTRVRVVVESSHRNGQRPLAYLVKIELSVPGRQPIVISHERAVGQGNDALQLCIRDAFEAATRRVEDVARKISERARSERGRRRPSRSSSATTASE